MAGRLRSHMSAFVLDQMNAFDLAVRETAESGMKAARIIAPKDSYALVGSAKIKKNGIANVTVSFGDGGVPYARRRNFENFLHPNTKHYLERGMEPEVKKMPQAIKRNMKG